MIFSISNIISYCISPSRRQASRHPRSPSPSRRQASRHPRSPSPSRRQASRHPRSPSPSRRQASRHPRSRSPGGRSEYRRSRSPRRSPSRDDGPSLNLSFKHGLEPSWNGTGNPIVAFGNAGQYLFQQPQYGVTQGALQLVTHGAQHQMVTHGAPSYSTHGAQYQGVTPGAHPYATQVAHLQGRGGGNRSIGQSVNRSKAGGENSAHRVCPTRLAPRIIAPRDESPTDEVVMHVRTSNIRHVGRPMRPR